MRITEYMQAQILPKTLISIGCFWLIVGCTVIPATAKPDAKRKLGVPIVSYWAGPGTLMALDEDAGTHIPLNDQTAEQLSAGGWNMGWAKKPEDIDVLYRHGIRAMLEIGNPNVEDPEQAKALDALIEKVRNHPALYAYYFGDEPGARAFPGMGKLVAYLRQRDPAHLVYINLLPTYATPGMLGVSGDPAERAKVGQPSDFAGVNTNDETVLLYRDYLKRFVETVKPDLISYDHYHFMKDGDGAQYFLNLALVRQAALKADKPFLNIIQSCDLPQLNWRGPNEHELRWLTYTSLAYGAQGISHFRYDIGLWNASDDRKTPMPLYWALCRINHDFVAIAMELQPLKSLGVYHCGTLPMGGQALPEKSVFAPEPRSQEVLLGYFGKSAGCPTYVVVMNMDYKNAVATTLVGPGPMQVFHAPTQLWSARSECSRLKLNLPPGGGVLVRLGESRRQEVCHQSPRAQAPTAQLPGSPLIISNPQPELPLPHKPLRQHIQKYLSHCMETSWNIARRLQTIVLWGQP